MTETVQPSASSPPGKDDILATIGYDIDALVRDQSAGGWTTWALAGAVAACASALVAVWQGSRFSVRESALFFLVSCLWVEGPITLFNIAGRLPQRLARPRYWLPVLVAGDRARMLYVLVWCVVLGGVFWRNAVPLLSIPLVVLGFVFFLVPVVVAVTAIGFDVAGMPFQANVSSAPVRTDRARLMAAQHRRDARPESLPPSSITQDGDSA